MSGAPGTQAARGQLRRGDKAMAATEVDALLQAALCGRTATVDADGFPYVVPNLFCWHEGRAWLHTTRADGHFAGNVARDGRACFEVDEPGEVYPYGPVECDTSLSYRSVVLFGHIDVVEDTAAKERFFARFMAKYAPPGSWGREQGTFPRLAATRVYCITPERVTGKVSPLPIAAARWHPRP